MVKPMPTRRQFLQTTSLATLGTAAAHAIGETEAIRASGTDGQSSPKSFILLWLNGGPSQLETFDPHPNTSIGGPTRAIETPLKGISFAEHLPRLAELAPKMTLLRSVVSKEGDHARGQYAVRTGFRPEPAVFHPTLGAIAAKELPTIGLDLPPYISILTSDLYTDAGYLGADYQAYLIGNPNQPPRNLQAPVSPDRMKNRQEVLSIIESRLARLPKRPEAIERAHLQTDRALRMMASPQQSAFDISQESNTVRDHYGRTPFGNGCLAARRLLETGVRAIEVTLGGWDTHATNFDAHARLGQILDQSLSALLSDLEARGRLRDTLVVCTGEFGRSPKINGLDGRDHWPHGFSVMMAGAGLPPGTVIGATDPSGGKEPKDPITIPDLTATILTLLGINPMREFITATGRPIKLSDGTPIEQLVASLDQ
jgi:uncharacterized protein (DUF1501 family)